MCKLLGTFLRLYMSSRIGSEGMGLYSLIMSVYTLFTTVATAGFTFTVSRLSAEEGRLDARNGFSLYKASLIPALLTGIVACAAMLFTARLTAVYAVGDENAATAIRVLAFSLPFMSVTSCMKGLFISRRKVAVTGSGSLTEQLMRIAVITAVLSLFLKDEIDACRLCTGIVFGITCGEAFSFLYLGFFTLIEKEKGRLGENAAEYVKRILRVNTPVSLSVCATSLLHTGESVLIPAMLAKFSGDRAAALSDFGIIRGMVIPLLFFPFAFLGALTSVTIPEVSRLCAFGDRDGLADKVGRCMRLAYIFGIAAGGLFFFLALPAGKTFYPGSEVTLPLKVLAVVTPFMYAETVADSLLKAIGGEKHTLVYSLLNSALRIAMILLLIPAIGCDGYLVILCVSNTFQYLLTVRKLKKLCGYRADALRTVLLPLAAITLGGLAAAALPEMPSQLVQLIAGSAVMAAAFVPSCLPALSGLKR